MDDIDSCSNNINSSTLDEEIYNILQMSNVSGDLKWVLYFRALENALYKKYPMLNPLQFNFKVEEESGNFEIKINERALRKKSKVLKYISFCLGPCISAALAQIIKRCDII